MHGKQIFKTKTLNPLSIDNNTFIIDINNYDGQIKYFIIDLIQYLLKTTQVKTLLYY